MKGMGMDTDPKVLVLGEIEFGALTSTTKEVLVAGHGLSKTLKEPLCLALVGLDAHSAAERAINTGVDRVYVLDTKTEDPCSSYLPAMEAICKTLKPEIILIGRTDLCRDIGPRLAFRLGVPLAQDCIDLKINSDGRLLVDRPIMGGDIIASIYFSSTPQIASVRPKVYEQVEILSEAAGEIISLDIVMRDSVEHTTIISKIKNEVAENNLEDASIVIAGGRGVGSADPFFNELSELASLLGGSIGASGAAVSAGWVSSDCQIGLTGKSVTPELYIAVGISGASHHMSGCNRSKNIISINKDSKAHIFKESRFGVVGDWSRILPEFTQLVKKLLIE